MVNHELLLFLPSLIGTPTTTEIGANGPPVGLVDVEQGIHEQTAVPPQFFIPLGDYTESPKLAQYETQSGFELASPEASANSMNYASAVLAAMPLDHDAQDYWDNWIAKHMHVATSTSGEELL